MKKLIVVKSNFEALHAHRTPEATINNDLQYLAREHQHNFCLEVYLNCKYPEAEENEFVIIKSKIDAFLIENCAFKNFLECNCSVLANFITTKLKEILPEIVKVSLYEDNKNGIEIILQDSL